MSAKRQISIELLGRTFSMRATADEEAVIREAARLIAEKLDAYRPMLQRPDDLYLALMCCLDLASECVKTEKELSTFRSFFAGKLAQMHQMLDAVAYDEPRRPPAGPAN